MHITIVVGSHRPISNSAKIASLVSQTLKDQSPEINTDTIDLGKTPLPIWDEKVWQGTPEWSDILKPYRDILTKTDGLVIISPEYCGMASPALKNFFLFWTGDVIAHKPAMIVGVTSTEHGGSYPISELRSSSYKNSRILYIPDHVIIRSAEEFPAQVNEIKDEAQLRQLSRLRHGTKILLAYSETLKPMRATTDFQYKEFGNGM
jgi:NAD(P)H-dependent FMN reductase